MPREQIQYNVCIACRRVNSIPKSIQFLYKSHQLHYKAIFNSLTTTHLRFSEWRHKYFSVFRVTQQINEPQR